MKHRSDGDKSILSDSDEPFLFENVGREVNEEPRVFYGHIELFQVERWSAGVLLSLHYELGEDNLPE